MPDPQDKPKVDLEALKCEMKYELEEMKPSSLHFKKIKAYAEASYDIMIPKFKVEQIFKVKPKVEEEGIKSDGVPTLLWKDG